MTDMALMKDIVLKIEAAEEARRSQAVRIQALYARAETAGLDLNAIRELIRERATPGTSQPETTVDVYRRAMEA